MQKKLRIAIVCDSIDTTLGGSITSAQRFAAGLREKGHDIIRIVSKFQDISKKKDFPCAAMYEFPSLFPLGPQKTRFAYTSVARLYTIFQQEKIDVVYSIHPTIIAYQAIRAAKRLHIPVVSHSHVWPELILPRAPGFIQRLVKKLIAGIYRKSDGLISPTAFTQNIFADCHFTNKQIIISNGVDTAIFHPSESKSNEKFNILYVGRLDPEKNLYILVDALHLLQTQKKTSPDMRCILVGSGSEEQKLKKLVEEYGLSHLVEFAGRITSDIPRITKFYQTASAFVLPSLYELESMVTLEAMACGCPLLIADSPTSAAKDFVHNNGYTFDCKDPKDLAEKIYKLSNNPELCELMGKISSEEAQHFSFTTSVEKLESFLSSFVHR